MDNPTELRRPFSVFCGDVSVESDLRARISAAYRSPEPDCVPPLIAAAEVPAAVKSLAQKTARRLITELRSKQGEDGVEGLIQEYGLSSDEGVALMCLAEALLRIPDAATRDALIRDKIGGGDWKSHLGHSPSLFVNAATWGLVVARRLVATSAEDRLSAALVRLLARGGEPLIRRAVDVAMRMIGEQFVFAETIDESLVRARKMESRGFRYSYDMLGEAAVTSEDAARYFAAYEQAIEAIGASANAAGPYDGPGMSIKLSALHPRYARSQRGRVAGELLPRVKALAGLARSHDIGLNIDAEEADRLDLSLDILEALCFDPALRGWNGLGFVVQAYQKRAPFVLDFIIDLAHRSGRRLMVRLVKGAYWDSEIKRAQVDGLQGFPVFTRKIHTDVCYIACARKMLAAPAAIYPQFATHNAYTAAMIHALTAGSYRKGQYEFQCLHGMGEPLYEEVVGADRLDRPCRIYAPVGTHETLLAYLVRRLLENGANSSFVNRIADEDISIDALLADPVDLARAVQPPGAAHEAIALPADLYRPERKNSAGFDFSNEQALKCLGDALTESAIVQYRAVPLLGDGAAEGQVRQIRNPADLRDTVGEVEDAAAGSIARALHLAAGAAAAWAALSPSIRADCLDRAADLMEERQLHFLGLIVREAGKSLPDAVGEVREAVDFLRYYASQARRTISAETDRPLGPVVCISPWNFPLSIFTGQVAGALAAGNPVLAKPAEETPLIASVAVELLREAGIPEGVLQFLPGFGDVGAALVADPRVCGVVFTGSTAVARLIQRQLAQRVDGNGKPIPFIAETGGQNALIVDSSALAEQVVADALQSAFNSAGQRCSALRVLCLQDDIADRMLAMLKGGLAEICVGNPDRLSTDVGPVITAEARQTILDHIEAMRAAGHNIHQHDLPGECANGTFVAPTLIELKTIGDLRQEVFGPVLHVVRFKREALDRLIDEINATGYALTFGLHTRIDETIAHVTRRIEAGNIYVNRNLIGAVVGVQPFGGHGLSGTGPKAGGPLYLRRLVRSTRPPALLQTRSEPEPAAIAWLEWLGASGSPVAGQGAAIVANSLAGLQLVLPGPVGERNVYQLEPAGTVLCMPQTALGRDMQILAALATGNRALLQAAPLAPDIMKLPASLRSWIRIARNPEAESFASVLLEGEGDAVGAVNRRMAARPGPIVSVHAASSAYLSSICEIYPLEWLLRERVISTNTSAAGGNASLMSLDL
ncbi:trifunctional transcriptional regulator/proline dehydrogenase/L-glutamate gamma-semialdehyde dehydrogenase [Roseiarcaceae bacterium H3SJ34-1]|uniref:trifunctional transcriptional regulator/proline dehydrogenase/L-glutamate gamma-semialdehyde dehydrogenase n=1 Tax=Terripilifer ovatus TaxID=3032367 RepID=UPI003AB97343|nr:trifunctional transcriptional regulator/proline dehydrogenase/L-glutamate gamma-semialdehyde dehydrogenase [Roseiarcaceae bacterium H3SJ34-1]